MDFVKRLLLIVIILTCFSADIFPAQGNVTTTNTIVYHQIREFNLGDIPGISRMKMCDDGSRIIFSSSNPKAIYTISSDGSNLTKIFDYADYSVRPPWVSPFIDIDASGSKIIWTDGVGEIFVANADGSGRVRIADKIPYNNTIIGPSIPVPPKLTSDGTRIYFANTSGSVDVGGIWRVNFNGSGLTQIFSYRQLTQFTGYAWDIYWGNYAFNHDFDISDDGSKIVFGTFSCSDANGRVIGHDGSFHVLSDYAPRNEGGLIISGDGNRVITNAWRFPERNPIFGIHFSGGQKAEIVKDAGGGTVIFGSISYSGSKVLAAGGNFPITLLDTYGRGRYDLVTSSYLRINGEAPFYYAGVGPTISMTADCMRFCFPTIKLFGFSSQSQIWVADINPPSLNGAPSISNITLSPHYAVEKGGSSSTFSADLGGPNSVGNVTFHTLKNGEYAPIFTSNYLFDNAANGDVTANDGLYVNNNVRTHSNVVASPFTVRFTTGIRQFITAVDVAPFFVVESVPSGPAPVISSIEPSSASPASQVSINGSGFNTSAGQNVVMFGNQIAYIVSATASQLQVLVPANSAPGTVQVTVGTKGQISSAVNFTVEGGVPVTLNPPQNLTASINAENVTLNWNPPLTSGTAILQKYNLYRSGSPSAASTGAKIGEVSTGTEQFSDNSLGQGTYYYQVTAVYDRGESLPSNEATATIGIDPDLKPPQNLIAATYENSVFLFWDPPEGVDQQFEKSILSEIVEVEPNNSPAEAQIITGSSPLNVSGNADTSDVGAIDDGYDDIEDLYLVTITSPGINITLSGFSSDLDLFLYDATGNFPYDESLNTGAGVPEVLEDPQFEPGTYLIGVSIFDVEPQGPVESPYTLTVTGEIGEGPGPSSLLSYNIYRSNAPNPMNSGTMIQNVDAFTLDFQDVVVQSANYYYQVSAIYTGGESGPSNEAFATYIGVDEGNNTGTPKEYALHHNYPNPFNPRTFIHYEIPRTGLVNVTIYNVLGEKIISLINNTQNPGYYKLHWDGKDNGGNLVSGGLYICEMRTATFRASYKMLLLK